MKREYPAQPVLGIGAVIVCNDKILLTRRGSDPGRDKWSIPGGLVELGETVQDTVVREVKEESNLDVEVHSLIDVVDNLEPDKLGRWRYHFVILDYFVSLKGGALKAGSDAVDVRWVPLDEVEEYDLTRTFREFFEKNQKLLRRFNSR